LFKKAIRVRTLLAIFWIGCIKAPHQTKRPSRGRCRAPAASHICSIGLHGRQGRRCDPRAVIRFGLESVSGKSDATDSDAVVKYLYRKTTCGGVAPREDILAMF